MDEACKSNEKPLFRVLEQETWVDSGERVSNAWVIYPKVGDSLSKGGVIPDAVFLRMEECLKVGIFGPTA